MNAAIYGLVRREQFIEASLLVPDEFFFDMDSAWKRASLFASEIPCLHEAYVVIPRDVGMYVKGACELRALAYEPSQVRPQATEGRG